MGFLRGEDRDAARLEKETRRQRIQAALDDYIARAADAADAGDIQEEEKVLAAAWKWASESDGVFGGLQAQLSAKVERAMQTRRIRRSELLGFAGDTYIWKDRIVASDGVRLMDEHVQASMETAGQIRTSKRPTLTRMAIGSVLPGTALIPGLAMQKTTSHDDRELYFVLEHPEWAKAIRIDPKYTDGIRQLVLTVNQAANEIGFRNRPAAEASPAAPDPLDRLKKLGELRDAGVLSETEFDEQKANLLKQLS
jgi:hypothetical protein